MSAAHAARETAHERRLAALAAHSPWVLRVTEQKDRAPPVLVVKQRRAAPTPARRNGRARKQHPTLPGMEAAEAPPRKVLQERGLLYGDALRRVLPVLRTILARVQDEQQVGLELHRLLPAERVVFRGNLPLDDEAGVKLALIFKLHERVKEMDRVELIARRVERFTREEAGYWLSRLHDYGADAGRFALSGMKVVLGGQPKDKGVERMLQQLRSRS
jgi:hypothetical protein